MKISEDSIGQWCFIAPINKWIFLYNNLALLKLKIL